MKDVKKKIGDSDIWYPFVAFFGMIGSTLFIVLVCLAVLEVLKCLFR